MRAWNQILSNIVVPQLKPGPRSSDTHNPYDNCNTQTASNESIEKLIFWQVSICHADFDTPSYSDEHPCNGKQVCVARFTVVNEEYTRAKNTRSCCQSDPEEGSINHKYRLLVLPIQSLPDYHDHIRSYHVRAIKLAIRFRTPNQKLIA